MNLIYHEIKLILINYDHTHCFKFEKIKISHNQIFLYITAQYLSDVNLDPMQVSNHPVWVSPKSVQALASSMMSVYEQVRENFTSDMYPHYIFNPRHLTQWTLNLTR